MPVMAAIAVVGTVVSAYGAYKSYSSQKDAAAANAEAMRKEGEFTKVESIFQALKIQEATTANIGTAKAQYAGAGVVGGNIGDVVNDINFKGQRDALWVLYTGELAEEGFISRAAATQQIGGAQASATLASGFGNALTNFATISHNMGWFGSGG